MPQISHAYAVGRVRSLEKSLLSRQMLDRLVSAQSADDAARMLSEAGWGEAADRTAVDKLADARVREACQLVRECTAEPEITDCFLMKFDILNLKTLLKARLMGRTDPELSPNGLIDRAKMGHAVAEGKYDDLPEEYRETLQKIEQRVAVEADPLYIDSMLDKLMYSMISAKLRKSRHVPAEIADYFATKADSVNLLIALRAHDMGKSAEFVEKLFVEGGRIGKNELMRVAENPDSAVAVAEKTPYADMIRRGMERRERGDGLAFLEKLFDDYELKLIRAGRYEIQGIQPLVGYLLAREREASAVRLIVTAKAVNAPADALSARLREMYI